MLDTQVKFFKEPPTLFFVNFISVTIWTLFLGKTKTNQKNCWALVRKIVCWFLHALTFKKLIWLAINWTRCKVTRSYDNVFIVYQSWTEFKTD
jgi:hypothetical protein